MRVGRDPRPARTRSFERYGNVTRLLRARADDGHGRGPYGVMFPSPRRMLRDPSNTQADLRSVLDRLDYGWVTSHIFRKTVATRLDEAGMSVGQIAD